MKFILFIIGLVTYTMGLLWVGQGMGYIHWPESSFMINQMQWAYYGGGLSFVGILMLYLT